MNLEIVWTRRFKKDYKKAMKQGLPEQGVTLNYWNNVRHPFSRGKSNPY